MLRARSDGLGDAYASETIMNLPPAPAGEEPLQCTNDRFQV